jgi:sulfur relay (sulfurtransferase) DsrF/TusC family protein
MNTIIGIIVRSDPYYRRAGRERLDPALAAASLEIPLKVFFIGDGVLHLLPGQEPGDLPAAAFTRGWGAVAGLSERVELFVDSAALDCVASNSLDLPHGVQALDCRALASEMASCGGIIHV